MGDREGGNVVPFVGGVAVGSGIVALLYFLFGQGDKAPPPKPTIPIQYNAQPNAPFRCTCKSQEFRLLNTLLVNSRSRVSGRKLRMQPWQLPGSKPNHKRFMARHNTSKTFADERERRFRIQEAERIRQEQERQRLEDERRVSASERKRRDESRGGSGGAQRPFSKKEILGMSALAFLCLCLLYRGLGRRRARRILTMIGLGWLIPRNPYCDPNPKINEARLKWPPSAIYTPDPNENTCCTCKDR